VTPGDFQQALLNWFDRHGRKDLPWQQDINPYRVWVSEIMLQQTQVSAVIPYFERFTTSFPSLNHLAEASLDKVLAHWSGLGYYARARNLHKCAQTLAAGQGGEFPRDLEALTELPGIGRSTAGAIASISMGLTAPILDGNVKRVLARFRAIEGWPGESAVAKQLWQLAADYTPQSSDKGQRCNHYSQAIMDLGATLCTRTKPRCADCPLASDCVAYRQGNPEHYPGRKPRKEKPVRQASLLLLEQNGQLFLQQRPPSGIWGGLWCPPQADNADSWLAERGWRAAHSQALPELRHTFTHFHLDIAPLWIRLQESFPQVAEAGSGWYKLRQLNRPRAGQDLGLPAPIVKLVKQLLAVTSAPTL
jgi:A/G-specific adenine glycosylase